jgi:hypothetical protein
MLKFELIKSSERDKYKFSNLPGNLDYSLSLRFRF